MRRRIFILLGLLASATVFAQSPAPRPSDKAIQAAGGPLAANPERTLPDPKDPHGWVWESKLADFGDQGYHDAVEAVFADYEKKLGKKLSPGDKRHVGLKVMTEVAGLSTPPALVRAVVDALVMRGYAKADLFIVDQSERKLHTAGFLPLNAAEGEGVFDGVQVIALERGRYYSSKWSYDSNAPAPDAAEQEFARNKYEWKVKPTARQSLLPVPLLLDVDFWINLPMGADYGNLGPVGALINATLWTCSNTERFFANPQIGARAVAEIATVPEFSRGWVLSIMTLERYQFAGGPLFNSLYSDSEPLLLASANPVMLDKMLWDRVNDARKSRGIPELDRPDYLDYARLPETHLGDDNDYHVQVVQLP